MAVSITFHGAAHGVTGSKHLVDTGDRKILLDCGMHQGNPEFSQKHNHRLAFEPNELTDIIVSHGHLDHCGSLPTVVSRGYTGHIWSTPASRDVCFWILKDSAKIQEQDYKYGKKKCLLSEKECAQPLYTMEDADAAMRQFKTTPYGVWQHITPNIRFKFYDAGHILGSAVIVLEITQENKTRRIGFSGDLGRKNMPILKDPELVQEPIDYWITETTYGDRLHGDRKFLDFRMTNVINRVVERKGKIFMPAFSLGRTQELVYILHRLTKKKKIPKIPIFVDSPLAASMTGVFGKHLDCVDEETREEFLNNGENPFGFKNLTYTRDKRASQMLNDAKGPMIIISAAGMANAGRIQHHLIHGLSDKKNLVMITSYMAEHTTGRDIKERKQNIKIFDKYIPMRAEVEDFNEFSAHADYKELIEYISALNNQHPLKKVFLVHGETRSINAFKEKIHHLFPKLPVMAPTLQDVVELK